MPSVIHTTVIFANSPKLDIKLDEVEAVCAFLLSSSSFSSCKRMQ